MGGNSPGGNSPGGNSPGGNSPGGNSPRTRINYHGKKNLGSWPCLDVILNIQLLR